MVRGLEPRRELVRQANRRDRLQVGYDLPGVLHGQRHVRRDLADALVDPLVQPAHDCCWHSLEECNPDASIDRATYLKSPVVLEGYMSGGATGGSFIVSIPTANGCCATALTSSSTNFA